jgi:hypothetical protein
MVLTNLSAHKGPASGQVIEKAGCHLVSLSTPRTDFNPIGQAFAKARQRLRRMQGSTFDTVVAPVGEVLATITPGDCAGFFRAAGYRT